MGRGSESGRERGEELRGANELYNIKTHHEGVDSSFVVKSEAV